MRPATPPPTAHLERSPETGTGALEVALPRRLAAEAIGTAFLALAVVGSGIMAERLAPADPGVVLLANAAATAGALVGLILLFGAVSGAHLNPVVTLVARAFGTISTRDAALYALAQTVGAVAGVIVANVTFELPAVEVATTVRASGGIWLSEAIATIGLVLVIQGCARSGRTGALPYAVGLWIGAAYWFSASTSFANPALTVGRTLSDTFAGIAPGSAVAFVALQLLGACAAYALVRFLFPRESPDG